MEKDIVHAKMRRRIEDPRVLLLDCPLEYKKVQFSFRRSDILFLFYVVAFFSSFFFWFVSSFCRANPNSLLN